MFSDAYFPHAGQPMATLLQDQPKAASSAGGWQIPVSRVTRSGNCSRTSRPRPTFESPEVTNAAIRQDADLERRLQHNSHYPPARGTTIDLH